MLVEFFLISYLINCGATATEMHKTRPGTQDTLNNIKICGHLKIDKKIMKCEEKSGYLEKPGKLEQNVKNLGKQWQNFFITKSCNIDVFRECFTFSLGNLKTEGTEGQNVFTQLLSKFSPNV